eukprot:6209676-Pleurochrysis_carterae.AAC.4
MTRGEECLFCTTAEDMTWTSPTPTCVVSNHHQSSALGPRTAPPRSSPTSLSQLIPSLDCAKPTQPVAIGTTVSSKSDGRAEYHIIQRSPTISSVKRRITKEPSVLSSNQPEGGGSTAPKAIGAPAPGRV